ncbi:MAG TPA: hypothetical protein VHL78_10755 [Actinomycetota bacterium]|nr:hypothetical protein [Actinomycetota bacterium]
MDALTLVIIVVVVVIAAAIAVWLGMRQRRRVALRQTFGPEYDRTVEDRGDARAAERELIDRRERRERLDIRPLAPDARQRYAEAWRLVQERFVDRPAESVQDADRLVQQVMADRGYPIEDFEQRAADISVDHPELVENYRSAHAVAARGDGGASTEDLRRAMVHYRSLFNELLGAGGRP